MHPASLCRLSAVEYSAFNRAISGELYVDKLLFDVPRSDGRSLGKKPWRLGYLVPPDLATSKLPFFDRKTTLPLCSELILSP